MLCYLNGDVVAIKQHRAQKISAEATVGKPLWPGINGTWAAAAKDGYKRLFSVLSPMAFFLAKGERRLSRSRSSEKCRQRWMLILCVNVADYIMIKCKLFQKSLTRDVEEKWQETIIFHVWCGDEDTAISTWLLSYYILRIKSKDFNIT